jgi:hypothetical protein
VEGKAALDVLGSDRGYASGPAANLSIVAEAYGDQGKLGAIMR